MSRITGFHLPEVIGRFDLVTDEVMYYLYLPVKVPGDGFPPLPDDRLWFAHELLLAVADDNPGEEWADKYVYLTIKRMYVGAGVTANRPGWHCDGYQSDDLNYIWYDCVPTIFTHAPDIHLSPDHTESLKELEGLDKYLMLGETWYEPKQLLKLDDKVIHKVDTSVAEQQMRTFIKITVSNNRFNLKGNSKNPLLPDDGNFYDRSVVRNDPCQAQRDHYEEK